MDGQPILVVAHHADDHSWSFMDGAQIDMTTMLVVAMSEIIGRHPELQDMASLPPGWSARRAAVGEPWRKQQDEFHL